jgi:aminopeptidase N
MMAVCAASPVIGAMHQVRFGFEGSSGMRSAVVFALLLAACARGPRVVETPAPVVTPPEPVITAVVDTPPSVDTLAPYRVPPFRAGPLVEWGPTPPGESRAERLRVYDLQHQVTRIRFDWGSHAVVGSTTIRLAALDQELSAIAFDAVGMTIRSVKSTAGSPLAHAYDGRTLTVTLRPGLAPRARTTIVIEYETVRPKKGVYFVDRRHMIWTQGETEDTRYWVPTYDHPNDKTTWEFHVTTDSNERALSNGRLVSRRDVAGTTEWHWSQTLPASTYLMSVVAGDYVVLQDVWRSVPIGYWTYPDSIEAAWRGFGKTPLMLAQISGRTGIPYPWAKYDQSVAPDYIFGGMENVTATTQADDRILHPAWAEPEANAEALVAHELAHQWYGNYVTARNWAHIWLNEGFATFFEAVWAEDTHGADAGALARLAEQEETIDADRAARRPLVFDRWVTDPLELFFSGHIYPKGATVLQMLRRELGDAVFWSGMRSYTKAHALGSVVTDDFQRAMERASHRDLSRFFAQWVHGAGVPAFQISYAYDSAARSLRLTARQVQPRDELTALFDADVIIEVMTDAGTIRDTMAVRGETSTLDIALPAAPRSIRWDKGGWLLDVSDFPRPTVMLAHQLRHDDDILGRIEAAELLSSRPGDTKAVAALDAALDSDSAWAVRARAATSLGQFDRDPAVVAALMDATRDRDSRVRTAAVSALGALRPIAVDSVDRRVAGAPGGAPMSDLSWLRRMTTDDPSRYVRGAALVAYATLDPARAMEVIEPALARDAWLDIERTQAVHALGTLGTPDAWRRLTSFLAPGTSRRTRQATIAALVRGAHGREAELAAAIVPLLDADDLFIRTDAARALGSLAQPSSVAALEARLAIEAESRVINAILGALAALRPRS